MAQVATIVGVCEETVLRRIRQGVLPAIRFGRSGRSPYRIKISDLAETLEEGTCHGPANRPGCTAGPESGSGTSSTARTATRLKRKIARRRNDG
ncbi:MAG: helix-turn-helix domain-containing protein [Alphaproteobacteria bacterium]|nr:helix-turn-helix domain-containing protein [Alphaproteobacteria bacterium]